MTPFGFRKNEQVKPSPGDEAAYLEAMRMLSQYGISYVYDHPEVLLGIAPGTAAAERLYARMGSADRRSRMGLEPILEPVGRYTGPRYVDNVLREILNEYEMRDQVSGYDIDNQRPPSDSPYS